MQEVQKIAVFRALMLGDLLVAVPSFRALRRTFPHARIALIGLGWARAFVERFGMYLDDFLEFPGFPGLPEIPPDVRAFPRFLAETQRIGLDLAIQLHGSGSYVNSIVSLLGAKTTAGFYVPGEWCPDADTFIEYPDDEPEIRRNLRLVEHLGAPSETLSDELEFPLSERDRAEFAVLGVAERVRSKELICIHAGARFESRRWPAKKFAAVGDALAGEGFQIALTGTESERGLTAAVKASMKSDAIDLAGKTSLGALGCLLKDARLLISNDTGVSHVAAALKTPTVVVVLGSDPERWQSYDRETRRVVSVPVGCRPCAFEVCPVGDICGEGVSEKAVLSEAFELLRGGVRRKAKTTAAVSFI